MYESCVINTLVIMSVSHFLINKSWQRSEVLTFTHTRYTHIHLQTHTQYSSLKDKYLFFTTCDFDPCLFYNLGFIPSVVSVGLHTI